jgi:glycosyltransferase involved in cell wall biosynthesis
VKILHLTDLFSPNIGGTETYIQGLVREQQRRGHDVAVLTLRKTGPPSSDIEDTGYRVHRIDGGLTRFQQAWKSSDKPYHPPFPDPVVARTIARLVMRERPDVVHAHNWIVYSYLAVKARSKPPVVWTQHDNSLTCPRKTRFYFEGDHVCPGASLSHCLPCSAAQYGRLKGAAVTIGLFTSNALLLGRCDTVTASASSVARLSRSLVGDSSRVVHLAGFTPAVDVDSHAKRERPGFLPARDGYLLFVGALGVHKGIVELLAAYARLSGAPPLVVIGTRQADSPVEWPPGTVVKVDASHDDVMAAWRHCCFGVVPSLCEEGFGLAVLEAGVMGKPVVASEIGGLADLVVDGVTGVLVQPGDIDALSGAMTRLLADRDLVAALGQAALTRAMQYTVDEVADRFDELAAGLVAARYKR